MAAAPAYVSDDVAAARDKVRWFPALVSNHVVDLINKYPKEELPEALWRYVEDREGYDYLHHAEVGSDNARVRERRDHRRVRDRRAGIRAPRALAELAEAGVTQFNIYLMNGDEEEQLDRYGRSSRSTPPRWRSGPEPGRASGGSTSKRRVTGRSNAARTRLPRTSQYGQRRHIRAATY